MKLYGLLALSTVYSSESDAQLVLDKLRIIIIWHSFLSKLYYLLTLIIIDYMWL